MKIIIVLLSILGLNSVQVEGKCTKLLPAYYGCQAANGTRAVPMSEEFYQRQLAGLTSYSAALAKYRSIFADLQQSNDSFVECVRNNSLYDQTNYVAYFTNSSYFDDIVSIFQSVAKKYTRLPFRPITLAKNQTVFDSDSPTLNKFCYDYDFTGLVLLTYDGATSNCYNTNANSADKCAHLLPLPNNLDNYVKCRMAAVSSCDTEIKRLLLFDLLAGIKDIVRGGMLVFINAMIQLSTKAATIRKTVWVLGDPHVHSITSGFETCNFNTTLNCIGTPTFQINCTAGQFLTGQNVTMLTALSIQFIKDLDTVTYAADQAYFPQTLSNQRLEIYDRSGNRWIYMTLYASYVIITDLNSRSTILIGKWYRYYYLIVKSAFSDFTTTGLLFDGCPAVYDFNTVAATASLDVQSICKTNSKLTSSSDVLSSDLYRACVNDLILIGDFSYSQLYLATSDASMKINSVDETTFSAAFRLSPTPTLIALLYLTTKI